ncbi:fimbrial protein [Erwinia persicina]|uniref:fimbrial protein n=1 Tax=Erwinia persicina TaxID=55211 RepID=UPI001FCE7C45|nr:fimbrial protein [Erwinia persicina]
MKNIAGFLLADWRGLIVTLITTFGASALIIAGVVVITQARAADNWNVDGANGVLQVHGALTESACRLDMASDRQDFSLGEIGTGRLRHLGDQGTPVEVQIKLRDCLAESTGSVYDHIGNRLWSREQPVVTVSFLGPADDNNAQLLKVVGAGGIGLRITDLQGRDVRLGSSGEPLLLTPGQNQLNYTITPERTRAPLKAGAYQAQVNFGLSYD